LRELGEDRGCRASPARGVELLRAPGKRNGVIVDTAHAAGDDDAVPVSRRTLRLDIDDELEQRLDVSEPNPETDVTR
jgi:hypothetical protein